MNSRLSVSLFGVCGWILFAGVEDLGAADWSQFRGDQSRGRSQETGLPTRWSSSDNIAWRTAMPGPGSSSPIVSRGRVFVTCYSGYGVGSGDPGELEQLVRHVVCLEQKSGKILWSREVPASLPEDPYRGYITEHGYASNTPVSDGERVFVFFGKTGMLAFDFEGTELWRTELGKESSNRRWGSAASPILYKDDVIVNASEESQAIVALSKDTGKEVWRAEAASLELAYGTPQLSEGQNGRVDLLISVPQEVWGLDPGTGKLRWYAETGLPGNICPSLTVWDGLAYGFGGYPTQGSFAVKLGGSGDVTQSHILWKSRISSYVASPVYHEGHLYWVTDRGDAMCVRAEDGGVVYSERLPQLDSGRRRAAYASLVYADEYLYAVTRYSGTYVLKARPEFELVARNQLEADTSQFNGTPALSEGQIILRSDEFVYAIGGRAGRAQ